MVLENPEPLLQDSGNRFTIFPIKYENIWNAYLTQKAAKWTVDEVDLTRDLEDWSKLDDNERTFIKYILAFFAASDGIVNENLVTKFFNEVKWAEARLFYGEQISIENEHNLMYSQLIETLVTDPEEKLKLFNAINNIVTVKKKAEWALKWITDSESFATRLVAFAIVEGIFFSGSFCGIYWINEKKLMPGLSISNQYIARDEGLHTDFAVLLYKNYIVNKLSQETIYKMISSAVEIEKEFILEALKNRLVGINADSMSIYIEFCADRLLEQLGYKPLYNAVNPFDFMDAICLTSSTNFFDSRSADYKRKLGNRTNKKLKLDCDF